MAEKQYTISFTNNTGAYVLLGDSHEIIFCGAKADCEAEYNRIEIESSKWGDVQVVAPGATVTGNYLHSEPVNRPSGLPAGLFEYE